MNKERIKYRKLVRSRKDLNKEKLKIKKDLIRRGGSIEKDEIKYRKGLKKERFKQVNEGIQRYGLRDTEVMVKEGIQKYGCSPPHHPRKNHLYAPFGLFPTSGYI